MRKGLVLLVLLLLAAAPVFGQWHRSARLSVTDSISYTSRSGGWGIGVTDEDVHITWYDKSFLPSTVRYGHFPIGCCLESLASGIAINSDDGCEPVLSASDTNAHIDWYVNSLFFRETVDMGVNPIVEHGWSGTSNLCPAIADDASGNTHCVFNYYDDSRGLCLAYQRRTAGGTFSPPVEIIGPPSGSYAGFSYYPTICISPNGDIHAAWIQPWKGNAGYGTSADGSNWTVSEIPSTNCNPNVAPSICCSKWGTIHVVYASQNDEIYIVYKSGATWSNPTSLSERFGVHGMICDGSSICADTSGSVWAVWHGKFSEKTNDEIYCNDPRVTLTSNDHYPSECPNVTADPNGNIHIIWGDSRDGNFEIYYNWRLGPGQGQGRDLAVTCIYRPVGRIENQSTVSPRARIGNFGEALDSCYGNCTITGPGSSYSEDNVTKIIGSGADASIGFPPWTPSGNVGDIYQVKVTLYILPEKSTQDDNPANNVFIDSCIIRGVAVAATTILDPQEGDTLEQLTPAAYFRNTGTEPAANFYCHCDIASAGFHGDDYADSVLVAYSLAVGDSVFIEFDDYGCEENCSYAAVFHATSATEDTIYSPHIQVHFHGPYSPGVAEPAEVLRIELAGTNPFEAPPWISYSIGVPTEVSIRVYDVSGKLVEILHDGELSGKGTLHWNGKDQEGRTLAAGLYFVRILTPQFDRTHKIVLVR